MTTRSGQRFTLNSGQQLLLDLKPVEPDVSVQQEDSLAVSWAPPAVIAEQEVERRLQKSRLINGFSSPLDTLPEIERELGVTAPSS